MSIFIGVSAALVTALLIFYLQNKEEYTRNEIETLNNEIVKIKELMDKIAFESNIQKVDFYKIDDKLVDYYQETHKLILSIIPKQTIILDYISNKNANYLVNTYSYLYTNYYLMVMESKIDEITKKAKNLYYGMIFEGYLKEYLSILALATNKRLLFHSNISKLRTYKNIIYDRSYLSNNKYFKIKRIEYLISLYNEIKNINFDKSTNEDVKKYHKLINLISHLKYSYNIVWNKKKYRDLSSEIDVFLINTVKTILNQDTQVLNNDLVKKPFEIIEKYENLKKNKINIFIYKFSNKLNRIYFNVLSTLY